jgi:hypothetical protein
MFNSIAYSQNTETPYPQKIETITGFLTFEECRIFIEESSIELAVERRLNEGYKIENTELIKENALYARDNKNLKQNIIVYKVLGFGLGVLGFYMGSQL